MYFQSVIKINGEPQLLVLNSPIEPSFRDTKMENIAEIESPLRASSVKSLDETEVCSNKSVWMPSSIEHGHDFDEDYLFKKCQAIFNKITTVDATFRSLMEEIKEVVGGNDDLMNEIGVMYFEKAIDEPLFLNAYVQFSVNLSQHVEAFKKAIIGQCQRHFERNVLAVDFNEQLQLLSQKINDAVDPTERDEYQISYDETKRQLTQKSTNIVRFIGELFNKGMLTPSIMMKCIKVLLDRESEHKLECVCNLLTTIGACLERKFKHVTCYGGRNLSFYFRALLEIADNQNQTVRICNRLRCMILNVVDLRKNYWIHRRETVNLVELNAKLNQNRAGHSKATINRSNDSMGTVHKKTKLMPSVNIELIPKRMKEFLKTNADLDTIQNFITNNLAGVDEEYVRAILRSVVEYLMDEKILKSRGNNEAALIVRTFLELLEN